jgi:Zn-dependent peptidase ImmA (M78 family)
MGRLSWSSVAENKGDVTYIRYWNNRDFDKNHKRFCIAHELYHIIWSVGSSSGVPRNAKTEYFCDAFANDLCSKHDKFYEAQAKIKNGEIRFHGLPFKSV